MNLKRVELSLSAAAAEVWKSGSRGSYILPIMCPKEQRSVFAGNNRETRTWRQTEGVPLFLSLHHYVP